MDHSETFYTLKGYQLIEDPQFTPAMEDYLEMICRILQDESQVRIRDLSKKLNVKPSSASKMIQQLSSLGYLSAQKYGNIELTDKGKAAGYYLLYRHNVIFSFLCFLNKSENELEEAEKIEHFLGRNTVENLDDLLKKLKSYDNDQADGLT
ncbi:MAG: iron dependent repressor, metal binding and dimerization domain protein [Oscillospiraceae bacterium]|nr:iron dependent repressor, metal binding and dimerization domain protein [Oscillospiraceae bacterium]